MIASEKKVNQQALSRQAEWERRFRLSEQFIRESGRMPKVREVYDGVRLYRWLILEKSKYLNGKMDPETVERFRRIGVDIANFSARPHIKGEQKAERVTGKSYDEIFGQTLQILKKFVRQHRRFPDSDERFEDFPIGHYCEKWRRMYRNKQISKKRIRELNQIDFPWTATELKWRKNFLALKDFLKQFGRFPHAYEKYGEIPVGTWLYRQRHLFRQGKLNARRRELLEQIRFMSASNLRSVPDSAAL